MTPAVTVVDVAKRFRLYRERNQSLKASFLRGRRATYDDFWALDGVSLEISEGTTCGLIGHNGSGKSTLLKCMARILQPDRGEIVLNGRMSALLELGAGFHPELSGRENVYLNGSILGMSKRVIDQKFDEIVDFSGLARFIDNPVKTHSSGMYVRLGFAVAISVEPEVLLVDEVLAVGDEEFQRRCADRVRELQRSGSTIVIVSHGMQTVRELCDQVVWLDGGTVQKIGQPQEIIDAYHAASIENEREQQREVVERGAANPHITRNLKVEALSVSILDAGDPAEVHSGDPLRLRVELRSNERVQFVRPTLGLHSSTGAIVTVASTADSGADLEVLDGTVELDFEIPELYLRAGVYDISLGAVSAVDAVQYDSRLALASFRMVTAPSIDKWGMVDLRGQWSVASKDSNS